MRNIAHISLGVIGWVLFGIAMILAMVGGGMSVYDDGKLGVEAWASSLEMIAYPFLATWIAVFAIRWKPNQNISERPNQAVPDADDVTYRRWLEATNRTDSTVSRDEFERELRS